MADMGLFEEDKEKDTMKSGIITKDGQAAIQFQLSQRLDLPFLLVRNQTPCLPDHYVRYYYISPSFVTVVIRVPDFGVYTLLISARRKQESGFEDEAFTDIARYLVRADTGHMDPFPPSAYHGQIGQFIMIPPDGTTLDKADNEFITKKGTRYQLPNNNNRDNDSDNQRPISDQYMESEDSVIAEIKDLYDSTERENLNLKDQDSTPSDGFRASTKEFTRKAKTPAVVDSTMKVISLPGPILTCPESGELSFCFDGAFDILPLDADLLFYQAGNYQKQDMSQYLISESPADTQQKFMMRFPLPGVYTAEIYYATDLLYVYIIYVPSPAKQCFPYPVLQESVVGLKLHQPSSGRLTAHEQVFFKVSK